MPSDKGLPNDEASLALRGFRQVFNAVKTHFRHLENRSGLGGAQIWALSIIREHPGIGIGELARSMDIQRSTASNLVKSLLDHQLIDTEKSAADRRSVQLRILPAGLAVLRKAPAPLSGVLPDALAQLDPATLRNLNRGLGKLLTVLKKVDDKAAHKPLADL